MALVQVGFIKQLFQGRCCDAFSAIKNEEHRKRDNRLEKNLEYPFKASGIPVRLYFVFCDKLDGI